MSIRWSGVTLLFDRILKVIIYYSTFWYCIDDMTENIQQSFKALADPSRREILMHLSKQDMTIKEVSEHFDMTRAAVKKHLNILEKGNLISIRKNGRERINTLKPEGLRSVTEWMDYFNNYWDQKLNSLQVAIKNHSDENGDKR